MSFLKYLCVVFVLVSATHSFRPTCVPNNQFKYYCFEVEYCTNIFCGKDNCGRYIINSKLVKIKETNVIPQCAFTDSEDLNYIYGVSSKIQVLASGSFSNLPNVENINLAFNEIQELHQGTFKNVTAKSLDLSWNKMVYIQEGAFEGLLGLRYLNLSRNELTVLPIHQMPKMLKNINLSFNFFNRILLNSNRVPQLTEIDLSNNVIENIALSFDEPVKKVDLTNNRLQDFDYMDFTNCKILKIKSNKFSRAPKALTYLSVEQVHLYPNPWNCDELKKLWGSLQNNFVTTDDPGQQPLCTNSDTSGEPLSAFTKDNNVNECDHDGQCGENLLCRSMKCMDPCKENICDTTSICNVTNHIFTCQCPENLKRNPYDVYSVCLDVDCFVDSDCNDGKFCNYGKKCSSNRRPGGHGHGGHAYGGHGGHGGHGGYGGHGGHGGYGGHGGHGGYGGTQPVEPVEIFTGQDTPEEPLPWWFDEIPKLKPSHAKETPNKK